MSDDWIGWFATGVGIFGIGFFAGWVGCELAALRPRRRPHVLEGQRGELGNLYPMRRKGPRR